MSDTPLLSFYPGPSQLHPQMAAWMQDAVASGLLSSNHRSPEFVRLCRKTVRLLRQKLGIPAPYQVFFTSSATESWEIVSQAFISLPSLHVFNGAFGEKWYEYRQRLGPGAFPQPFSCHRLPGISQIRVPFRQGVICLTQNETSNGTQLSNRLLAKFRKRHRQHLLAVDATSSMGGQELDWLSADLWLASVQKCFGLPAGMGLLIASPKALQISRLLGHNQHYNSLIALEARMKYWQTTHTPNVLGIYLLQRAMETAPPIRQTHRKLRQRAAHLYFALSRMGFSPLIGPERLRSTTVICLKDSPERVSQLKTAAKAQGILLGNGYGTWKENTFRIANFPALSDMDFERLLDFLRGW